MYQVIFSLLVHHHYTVAILLSVVTLSVPQYFQGRCLPLLYDLLSWYYEGQVCIHSQYAVSVCINLLKSAMDFFGSCVSIKNSLEMQDSVSLDNIALASNSIILVLGSTGAIRSSEY